MRHKLWVLLLACVAAACSEPTAPEVVATVRVVPDTVSATSVQRWIDFVLPVTIHNAGVTSLRVATCASSVERSMADEWQRVWSPVCSAEIPPREIDIEPGELRHIELRIVAAIYDGGFPRWESAEIAGRYRVQLGLIPVGGQPGLIPTVSSNAFVLRGDE